MLNAQWRVAGAGAEDARRGMRGWAAQGWRRQGEWRELSMPEAEEDEPSPDLDLLQWCALAIRRASEEAVQAACRAAAAASGSDAA